MPIVRSYEWRNLVSDNATSFDPQRDRSACASDQTRATIKAYLGSLVDLGLGSEFVLPNIPPLNG